VPFDPPLPTDPPDPVVPPAPVDVELVDPLLVVLAPVEIDPLLTLPPLPAVRLPAPPLVASPESEHAEPMVKADTRQTYVRRRAKMFCMGASA